MNNQRPSSRRTPGSSSVTEEDPGFRRDDGLIPVSVIVATRNEEANIGRCLAALRDFSEVVVVDSNSTDNTAELARAAGARVENFTWNGAYPKKRQWCLDNLSLKHDRVFFVDADEVVTEGLRHEIAETLPPCPPARGGEKLKGARGGEIPAGYFVRGRYVIGGRVLRFGLSNNKLCIFDRRRMEFPVIDDLDIPGMGEIEGHYQPVLKHGARGKTGQLKNALLHYAYDEKREERHRRYAAWESGMNGKNAWPRDPVERRQILKRVFRLLPGRPLWAFLHCYVLKLGLLDGMTGFKFACDRFRYYRLIQS